MAIFGMGVWHPKQLIFFFITEKALDQAQGFYLNTCPSMRRLAPKHYMDS
jgi:hypothetical protein